MSRKKRIFVRLMCGFCAAALFAGSQSLITFADEVDEIEASIKEKQAEIDAANNRVVLQKLKRSRKVWNPSALIFRHM